MDAVTLALAKNYTDEKVEAGGSVVTVTTEDSGIIEIDGSPKQVVNLAAITAAIEAAGGSVVTVAVEESGIVQIDGVDKMVVDISTLGGGAGVSNQLTKLGVTAPSVNEIATSFTTTFLKGTPTVLKFTPGIDNEVRTTAVFDNGDESDFEANEQLIFDGQMSLKTTYTEPMVDGGMIGASRLWSYTISKSLFKTFESLEVA